MVPTSADITARVNGQDVTSITIEEGESLDFEVYLPVGYFSNQWGTDYDNDGTNDQPVDATAYLHVDVPGATDNSFVTYEMTFGGGEIQNHFLLIVIVTVT